MTINLPKEASEIFYEVRELPIKDWECFWEKIYLPYEVKNKALNYIIFAHLAIKKLPMSSLQVAFNLSKAIIFYGPPGNGKSKIARGLANKAATFFRLRNQKTIYVELNAHRLSSRWLGGSPQLVQKAFEYVKEIAQQADVIFFVIDEVESLLTNRALTLSEANPVDVFRAVNAVIQEIDNLVHSNSNVFLIATSNLPKAIELAFLDRTDMKIFVDFPDEKQREMIIKDTLEEFNRVFDARIDIESCANKLVPITEGFSARQIRKVPLEAVANSTRLAINPSSITIEDLVEVVISMRKQMEKDRASEGVYEYIFKKENNLANKDERELEDEILLKKFLTKGFQ